MIKFKLFGKDGIAVEINFLFVAMVTLFLLTDKTGFAVIGLIACLMHELGHIVAFFIVGATPKLLSFEVTGIRLQEANNSLPRLQELFVLFAGSFVNLMMFFLIHSNSTCYSDSTCYSNSNGVSVYAIAHLMLGIFNLFPLKSFDGGKILALIISYFLPVTLQEKICSIIDLIFIIIILMLCVFCFLTTKNNFTLLVMGIYLVFSGILKAIKNK